MSACATSDDCLWGSPCLANGACDYESCDAWHAWVSAQESHMKSRAGSYAAEVEPRACDLRRSKTRAKAQVMLTSGQLKTQRDNFVTQHLVPGFREHRECSIEVLRLAKQAVDRFSVVLNVADLPEESDLLAQRFLNIRTLGDELDRQVGLANIHSPQMRTPAGAGARSRRRASRAGRQHPAVHVGAGRPRRSRPAAHRRGRGAQPHREKRSARRSATARLPSRDPRPM